MSFVGKWMELEIMLSEIATPTDKDHKFFSFVEAR
jgi:hypothetical protein